MWGWGWLLPHSAGWTLLSAQHSGVPCFLCLQQLLPEEGHGTWLLWFFWDCCCCHDRSKYVQTTSHSQHILIMRNLKYPYLYFFPFFFLFTFFSFFLGFGSWYFYPLFLIFVSPFWELVSSHGWSAWVLWWQVSEVGGEKSVFCSHVFFFFLLFSQWLRYIVFCFVCCRLRVLCVSIIYKVCMALIMLSSFFLSQAEISSLHMREREREREIVGFQHFSGLFRV